MKHSTSIAELSKRLKRRENFKLLLPGSLIIFRPLYDVALFVEGDIVAFQAVHISSEFFFIGTIRRSGMNEVGQRWYDVVCILRPETRDPTRVVNWLPKARISRASIICEIKAIR